MGSVSNDRDGCANSVYFASAFDGTDGGDRIQSAINVAKSERERRVVFVGPVGPDADDRWKVSDTIEIPSHTTLMLAGASLRLADGVGDNILRNESATSGDDARDTDIHIIGFDGASIDGNAINQYGSILPIDDEGDILIDDHAGNSEYEYFRRNGIDLYKVDGFTLRGFTIGPTNSYAIAPEDVTNGYIANITFRMDGTTPNQDAVNLGGPAEDVQMVDLRGTLADGAITISSRGTATSHKLVTEGGAVRHVHVENVCFAGAVGPEVRREAMGIIHTWPYKDVPLEHIRVKNIVGRNLGNPAIRTGGEYVTDSGPFTRPELHRDIVIDGVFAEGDALCELRCDVQNLTITNAYLEGSDRLFDQRGYTVDGLTVDNCVHDCSQAVQDSSVPGSIIFDGQLSDSSVRNCRIEASAESEIEAGIYVGSNASVDALSIDQATTTGTDIGFTTESGADVGRIALSDCRFDTDAAAVDVADGTGILRNGLGIEVSENGSPTANRWQTGDIVQLRTPSDNDSGIYLLGGDGQWARLSS
jgi:hypothetical protein